MKTADFLAKLKIIVMFPRVEFFKPRLFMKPAISEIGMLNFKKFKKFKKECVGRNVSGDFVIFLLKCIAGQNFYYVRKVPTSKI